MPESTIITFPLGIALIALPSVFMLRRLKLVVTEEKQHSRSPFADKLLRPPGESLRLKIIEFQDQINDILSKLAFFLIAPGLFLIIISKAPLTQIVAAMIVACSLGWGLALGEWKKLMKARKDLMNYSLGFDGERCVGAELTPLLRKGYYVYHDFLFDMRPGGETSNFNIDHIAIGPEGIFIIETKAKRKSLKSPVNELEAHEIAVEGTSRETTSLRFPDGSIDEKPIKQALRQSEQFYRWLNIPGITEKEIRPIVVYPGWWIRSKHWHKLGVQSATKIAERLPSLGKGRRLNTSEIKAIATRIEDKCRDIEGAR
ncbi:nuclease-related domain-containing protein [Rubritalea marina]|uniref:nuclease-related domain-containing protein n=1 Tax=Rubritalea marina TaxID=361055 RepID=UPI0003811FFB|nr:nuclease-related domain-containing protein [Rubritalea marina]